MYEAFKRISIICIFCLFCLVVCISKLVAQDTTYSIKPWSKVTTAKNDINLNYLNVLKEDPNSRIVIAYKLHPAIGGSAKNYNDSLKISQDCISSSISNLNSGNNEMALVNIYRAISFCPAKEIKTYAIANSYYGLIQIKTGNYTKAVSTLNMCDSLFRQLGDFNLLAFHYNNLGHFFQKFENFRMAETFFKKSLSLSRTLGNEESIAINLNNLAKEKGQENEKITFLLEAADINKRLNRVLSLAENFNNLAFHNASLKNYPEAIKYLDRALTIAKEKNSPEVMYDNYRLRSQVYADQGRYQPAYEATMRMLEMKNELDKKANTLDIEQIIQNRELAKKEYDFNLHKKEYDIKRLNTSLIITISLLIITLMISFYIYFYINNRRRIQDIESKQKIAEQEVEYAQTELVNLATYLNTRNEILDNIQGALSKSYKLPEKDIYSEIRKINMYIKNLQTRSEEIESVLAKITKINEGFISRLSEKHPELTKNDKNIALFLRANLSSKQIATLMDCSPKSVNMARYRMRSHLNLSNDTNLVSYLRSL